MKRLLRLGAYTEKEVVDAVNKVKHMEDTDGPAIQNAENVLGSDDANSYLIALVLRYNGLEDELEVNKKDFLYSGGMEPTVYQIAQDVSTTWASYVKELSNQGGS